MENGDPDVSKNDDVKLGTLTGRNTIQVGVRFASDQNAKAAGRRVQQAFGPVLKCLADGDVDAMLDGMHERYGEVFQRLADS